MPLQHGPRPDGLSDLCVILPTLRCLAFTAPVAKVSDQTALSLSLKACHFLRTAATLPTKFAFHRFAKMNRANPRYVQPTVKIQPTGVRHPKVSAPSVQNPEYGPSVAHLKHAVPFSGLKDPSPQSIPPHWELAVQFVDGLESDLIGQLTMYWLDDVIEGPPDQTPVSWSTCLTASARTSKPATAVR